MDFFSKENRNTVARKKQVTRMRRRFEARGDAGLGVYHAGVWHPHDCACYDCLYGEVHDLRWNARRPRGSLWAEQGDACEPRARGRTAL